jgi:hypothetical protein
MPPPVLGGHKDGKCLQKNILKILTDLLLARHDTGTWRHRCQRRVLAVQRVHMLQRRPGALALPVAREDVSPPLHVIENPNGADKSVPERVGFAFMGYGVHGASNEGAIIALKSGEVTQHSEMYSTQITLAHHGNWRNGSFFRH